ncbi:uncharacterized protein LOC142328471 [Lycorma delicatula]|uniref:uncharacterized protein LOC142328471 n=1 Tax=Lycorma delicatula TaxID=130591 RepID=UPI003F50EC11
METEIPSWLTKDYIKTALENTKRTSNIISLENMKINMPITKGDNYVCTVYRVIAEYKAKNENDLLKITLIIKAPHEGGIFSEFGLYEKEVLVYNELLPKFKLLFCDKWEDLTAESFYSMKDNAIILEDLKNKGYVMAERMKQLNLEESKVALSSLAKFHAASVKLYEIEPNVIKKVAKELLFNEEIKETMFPFIKIAFKSAVEALENQPELRKYIQKINHYGENVWNVLAELIKPKEGDFNVLNHGDFWTNNMMLKYVNNEPVNAILIDFQMCRYTSLAFDLIYFMISSVQEDIRTKQYDKLLDIYLEKLNQNLEIFGSKKRLDKRELNKAIEERKFFAPFVTLVFLPTLLANPDKCEIIDYKEMTQEDLKNIENNTALSSNYKNENYLKLLPKLLEEFDKKGLFLRRTENKLENETPAWITKDFIRKALENGSDSSSDSIIIENIDVDSPVAKGNNYACEILRVKVEYKKSGDDELLKTSLILKSLTEASGLADFMLQLGIIEKEVMIYNELIPKYKSVFGDRWGDLTPKSFFSTEKNVIILEDLKFKGYEMADRMKQLNFEECKIAFSALSKYHAASVKLYELEPELIIKVGREVFYNRDLPVSFREDLKNFFKPFIQEATKLPKMQKYIKYLENFVNKSWDILCDIFKSKEDEFNVLNHGDLWVTNMLFKYVDNKPIEVKLIDLQVSRYASPGIDILYFFHSSVQEEVRVNKYEELLNIYLKELNANLEMFGSEKRLDKMELKNAINKAELFTIVVNITLLPLVLADPHKTQILDLKNVTMDDFKSAENSPLKAYYNNEKCMNLVTKRFQEFEERGLFEMDCFKD